MALSQIFEHIERSLYEAVRVIAVGEGYTPDITTYQNNQADYAQYLADLATIKANKGLAIEIFSNSQPEQKGVIETSSISIIHGGTPMGNIGLPVQKDSTNYAQGAGIVVGTTLTNEYTYSVFLTARNLKEFRVVQGIALKALPSRSWVHLEGYDESTRFLNIMIAGYPTPSSLRGVKEFVYNYSIPDVLITDYTETQVIPYIASYSLELGHHLGI